MDLDRGRGRADRGRALTPVLTGRRQRALRSNDEAVAARSRYHQLGHYVEDTVVTLNRSTTNTRPPCCALPANAGSPPARCWPGRAQKADFTHAQEVAIQGLAAIAAPYTRLNRTLHMIAVVRLRYCQRTRVYLARRTADGLSKKDIMRCLKRYIAREIYYAYEPTSKNSP